MKKKIICVLGMHRSGTSVLSNVIHHLGVYWGEQEGLIAGKESNPDGFFELNDIVTIHDEILSLCNLTWNSVQWLDNNLLLNDRIQRCSDKLKNYIYNIFKNHSIQYFGFKDPRTCLLLPIWKNIFNLLDIEPIYIYMIRNPEEVALSLKKRDNYELDYGYCLWDYYNLKILFSLLGEQFQIVYYDSLMNNSKETCEQLIEHIWGCNNQSLYKNIEGILNPAYRHSVKKEDTIINHELTKKIFTYVKNVYLSKQKSFQANEKDIFLEFKRLYLQEAQKITVDKNWINEINKQDRKIKVYQSYYKLLLHWFNQKENSKYINDYLIVNKYEQIIIYGLGTLGRLLVESILKYKGVKILGIIDNSFSECKYIYDDIPLLKVGKSIFDPNALIIITPYMEYLQITDNLKKNSIVNPCLGVDEIIFRI